MSTQVQVVFDTADPHSLALFWAAALRYQQEDHSAVIDELLRAGHLRPGDVVDVDGHRAFREVAACSDPDALGPRLLFQLVAEPKTVKNRVHLDLRVGPEHRAGEVERLVELGATVAWTTADRGPVTTTLRDPEGNELCVS